MQENAQVPTPEVVPQVITGQPKQSNFLIILLSVLLTISVLIAGFFAYQTQKLVKDLTLLRIESKPVITYESSSEPVATISSEAKTTTDWKIYTNNDLKFSIKYPNNLQVLPEIIDVNKMRSDYEVYCKSHECGGSRWPDEIVVFRRNDETTAFGVEIFNALVSETFGGVEKDGKTFISGIVGGLVGMESIKMVPLDNQLLDEIAKTLKPF